MIEVKIPSRLYWPLRYDDDFNASEKHFYTPNPDIEEWVQKTCKGTFSVEQRSRYYTEEERKGHPWRTELNRVVETFAIFSRVEDAALFKMFWL